MNNRRLHLFFYSHTNTNMATLSIHNLVFVSREVGKNWKNNKGKAGR